MWQVVNGFSFVGWNYDRFLILCVLCKCDFMDNIPGWGLKRVHKAMVDAKLPAALLVPRGSPHPPVATRPEAWRAPEALDAYSQPVLRAVREAVSEVGGG